MTPYRANPIEKASSPDEALARSVIAPLLQPEEELLWAQRPKRGFVFHRRDRKIMFVSILWTSLSLYWALVAVRRKTAVFELIFAVPLALIGLHLMIFDHVRHVWQRASLFYGLTDRRVIIVRTNRQREVREFLLTNLDREKTALDFRGGGYTDIWLDERYVEDTQGSRHERMPTMPAVPNGESVFDQIIEQRAAALRRMGRTP